MIETKKLFADFALGKLTFDELFKAVDDITIEDPNKIPELVTRINLLHKKELLSAKQLTLLQSHLYVAPASSDVTRIADSPADDKTRVIVDKTTIAAPASTPSDQTRITPSQSNNSQPSTSPHSTMGTQTTSRAISHEPQVGDTLKGRFVLEKVIGRGGMGVVFKALDNRKVEARDRHPYVALKLLNESFKQHEDSLIALQREARKAQDLKHPNIIGIFDFDRDENDNYFIAMELLKGQPLDEVIKAQHGVGMPQKRALKMISKMGLALATAHHQNPAIVHSDFKPGNVFLDDDDDIKVFDFGIARAAKPKGINKEGSDVTAFDASTLGALTPTYASLEMLEGIEPDPSDDIYALAIVAYELLTGKRPFGRLPATEAKKQGLKPEQVPGLSKRQWKGLLRGLAFERHERTATAEAFLDDLRFRKSKLPLISTLSAVSIGVLTWLFLPSYLEKRQEEKISDAIKIAQPAQIPALLHESTTLSESGQQEVNQVALQQITRTIQEGNPDQIKATLEAVQQLPIGMQKEIFSDAKESILEYYMGQSAQLFAPQQQHYDYSAASNMLRKAAAFYPDSVLIFKTQQQLDDGRNDLLNALDERFNENLTAKRLLPIEDEDDISDILIIISQLDPSHDLLNDARLANAYTEMATTALEKSTLAEAEQYTDSGLALFSEDVALNNIKAKILITRRGIEARKRLAMIQQDLQQRLPKAETIEDYQALNEALLDLKAADAKDPLLKQAETKLRQLLDQKIGALLADRDWQQSEKLLGHFTQLLSPAYQAAQRSKLNLIKRQDEARINQLFAQLLQAVKQQNLTQPEGESAMDLLTKASRLAPHDSRISQSRNSIAYSYLIMARALRADAEWSQAQLKVMSGLEIGATEQINRSLQAEQQNINNAEKGLQKPPAERDQIAKQLQQELVQAQQLMTSTTSSSESVLTILDQIAAISPTNPLLSQGREQIAAHFSSHAKQFGEAREWTRAIDLAQQGVDIIPESIALSHQLVQLKEEQQNQLSAGRQQEIQQQKATIEKLLAKPAYSNGWRESLSQSFAELENWLLADDRWLIESREKTGRVYLEKALRERANKRFTNADALLQFGEQFAPMMASTFNKERAALTADEAAWQKDNKLRAEKAKLDGFKKSLLTQAKANDTGKALKSLQSLRKKLPQDDLFLTKTAPIAIGSAYLRLAERRAKRGDYESAVTLVNNGLKIAPMLSSLQEKRVQYREDSLIDKVSTALDKSTASDLANLKPQLRSLKKALPKRYAAVSKTFTENLIKRIQAGQDRKAALRLLDAARALFPDDKQLQAINLSPAPSKVIKPPPKVSKTEDRCQAKFAGYGKRSSKFRCYDMIGKNQRGPVLVVIPAGGGQSRPYAIGRYEISVGDYNSYCKLSGHCEAISNINTRLPLSGISLESAQKYARWLSEKSGATYRLPTDKEWLHAAKSKGQQPLSTNFNCLLLTGGAVVKGGNPVNVNIAPQNSWGLFNYVGNLQEWVSVDGGWEASGGHFNDSASSCGINLIRKHDGSKDKQTGFRLLREIKG
jgi:serine/threonine protein kinase